MYIYIYANIGGILMVNVTIYYIAYMDRMGYDISHNPKTDVKGADLWWRKSWQNDAKRFSMTSATKGPSNKGKAFRRATTNASFRAAAEATSTSDQCTYHSKLLGGRDRAQPQLKAKRRSRPQDVPDVPRLPHEMDIAPKTSKSQNLGPHLVRACAD